MKATAAFVALILLVPAFAAANENGLLTNPSRTIYPPLDRSPLVGSRIVTNGFVQSAKSNVVVVAVQRVTVPARLPGLCAVRATVEDVLEGSGLAKGQAISIPLSCGHAPDVLPQTFAQPVAFDPGALRKARQGVARVDDTGKPIWQEEGTKPYGSWGEVFGFRTVG